MAISTAVDPSAVARVLGIKTEFKNIGSSPLVSLPQRIAVIGQGSSLVSYDTTKQQVTSALEVAQAYGFGSPLHLAVLELLPTNGAGVGTIPVTVYPLKDDVAGVAAAGDITPSGTASATGSFRVSINNIVSNAFLVEVGDSVADIVTATTDAINGVLEMPVAASDDTTEVGLLAKWKGASTNDIFVEVIGPVDIGVAFAITQPTGGATNPIIDPALAQFGDVWETIVLNCLNVSDTTALDALQTFGEGRWGALVRRPLVSFVGNTITDPTAAVAVSDARRDDRINGQLMAPGSVDLPFVVAAAQLAGVLIVANANPPHDYGSLDVQGITPGADGDQWNYVQRDAAVKAGSSTIEVKNGVVNISDVVTFFHPLGDPTPAYRFVVDIVRLQNIIFNLDLIFSTPAWDGAPLIPDDQPTVNPSAKKPKSAKAAVASMLDNLGLQAIISDPKTAKANTLVEIDPGNPKRLNILIPVNLSGNVNIKSINLEWGFFFGSPTVVV